MKKSYIIGGIIALTILCGIQYQTSLATSCLYPGGGGTGLCTATSSNIGQVIEVSGLQTVGTTSIPIYVFANASGTGSVVAFYINGQLFVSTTTINFAAGSNVAITTSTVGGLPTYTISASGGGGSGSIGPSTSTYIAIFNSSTTATGYASGTYNSSTDLWTLSNISSTGYVAFTAGGSNTNPLLFFSYGGGDHGGWYNGGNAPMLIWNYENTANQDAWGTSFNSAGLYYQKSLTASWCNTTNLNQAYASLNCDTELSRVATDTLAIGTGTVAGSATGFLDLNGLVASGTSGNVTTTNLSIVGLGSTGSPCLDIGTGGAVATTTCGSGGSGVGTTSPFVSGGIVYDNGGSISASSSAAITSSGGISSTLAQFGTATTTNLAISGITGSTQCLHVNSSGLVSGTGSDCGSGGGGLSSYNVSSVNSTISVSTTTTSALLTENLYATAPLTITTGTGSSTFACPTCSTTSGFTNANASSGIAVTTSTSLISIQNTGVLSVNSGTGNYNIYGTTNEINVATGTASTTFSTPQAINTAANVQFGTLGLGASNNGSTISTMYRTGNSIGDVLEIGDVSEGLTGALGIETNQFTADSVYLRSESTNGTVALGVNNADDVILSSTTLKNIVQTNLNATATIAANLVLPSTTCSAAGSFYDSTSGGQVQCTAISFPAAITSLNGSASSTQTLAVVGSGNVTTTLSQSGGNSTTTVSLTGVIPASNGGTGTTTALGSAAFTASSSYLPSSTAYVSTFNGSSGAVVYSVTCISGCTATTSTTSTALTITGGSGGVGTTTPFSAKYLSEASTTGLITNSPLYSPSASDTSIGTTTDLGLFSVVNASNTQAFVVGSSTNAANSLTVVGHQGFATSSVSVSSCGTGSPTITGSDNDGAIVTGSSASACTVTFATKWVNPPVCVVSDSNTTAVTDVSSVSTSSVTFSLASALSAVNIYFICFGNPS